MVQPYSEITFQYISCYCLSSPGLYNILGSRAFQYISCYCLSIHLSLVLVHLCLFQYISCYCLSVSVFLEILLRQISIHLMLLFIGNYDDVKSNGPQFQYISCYCLSNGFPPFSIFLFPTNPLYLRFFSFLPSILLESFLYSIITYISLIFKLF